ncbi:DUF2283 domain-containing protein [Candidatus Uhrbacteria bacterium]|nr:DUF2283 domain-containing protein [Candidatus Uhrbacteria bacterium]
MAKISFDKDSHILSIRFKKKKSVDSEVQDNVVIDYDKDGAVVNIDVMGISIDEFRRPFHQMVRSTVKERTFARV